MKIVPNPFLSRRQLIITFLSVFGFVWLVLEPLPSLGILPPLLIQVHGKWIYAGMFIISGTITYFIEIVFRLFVIKRKEFISIQIIFSELGVKNIFEAPKDIKVDIFLETLMQKLKKAFSKNSLFLNYHMYDLVLIKQKLDMNEELSGQQTFRDLNINNDDIFKIKGVIKPIYTQIDFHADFTKEGRRRQLELVEQTELEEEIFNKFRKIAQRVQEKEILNDYFTSTEYHEEWKKYELPPISELEKLKKILLKNNWENPLMFQREF